MEHDEHGERDVDSVIVDEISEEQSATVAATATAYSIYEPHYQPMHPLIYYEEAQPIHTHHHAHSHHMLGPASSQHWEPEGYIAQMPMIPFDETSTRVYSTPPTGVLVSTVADNHQDYLRYSQISELEISDTNETKPKAANNEMDTDGERLVSCSSKSSGHELNGPESDDRLAAEAETSRRPEQTNRELHNEIERRRRLRIKQCCDVLRTLVPGLNDKTDKATVLEHTVKFVNHLVQCPKFKCDCEIDTI